MVEPSSLQDCLVLCVCVVSRDLATIEGLLVPASSWLSPVHHLPVQGHSPSFNPCSFLTPLMGLLQDFARRKLGSTLGSLSQATGGQEREEE